MLTEKEKKALKQSIGANRHEIFVISMEEMDAIIRSSPNGYKANIQSAWKKIRESVGLGAGYYASADDAVTLAKLLGDLGSFTAKAYIKTYGGKPHIILTGRAGLRTVLTGTKYGVKNPKVVAMGLGRAGAVSAAKTGGIVSIVLLTSYRVIDYVLTDEATLSQLVGTLATDIVKVGITTGASIAAATIAGGFTLAIGPILAVVLVGVGVSIGLEMLDQRFGITDRVVSGLDEVGDNVEAYIEQRKKNLRDSASGAVQSVIDYAVGQAQKIIVNLVRDYVKEFLSPTPRAR